MLGKNFRKKFVKQVGLVRVARVDDSLILFSSLKITEFRIDSFKKAKFKVAKFRVAKFRIGQY